MSKQGEEMQKIEKLEAFALERGRKLYFLLKHIFCFVLLNKPGR